MENRAAGSLFPRVKEYGEAEGVFRFEKRLTVSAPDDAEAGVFLLREHFSPYEIRVPRVGRAAVRFEKIPEKRGKIEYYELEITPGGATVFYSSPLAARDGAATFIALTEKEGHVFSIPACRVRDWADFSYRALMLDPARCFIPLDLFRERILLLAKAKYSVLHLHLLDNQGYVLKSRAVPEFNLRPYRRQYGLAEMKKIVQYAEKLGLTVIPELDLPAHSTFLLERKGALRCKNGKEPVGSYVCCVSNEETYRLVERLIDEILPLFSSKIVHMGGDELAFYNQANTGHRPAFCECDSCRKLAKEKSFVSNADFYSYFAGRVHGMLKARSRRMMIWGDSIETGKTGRIPKDVLIHFWRVATVKRDGFLGAGLQEILENGFEAVNSRVKNTYLDCYANEEKMKDWDPLSEPEVPEEYARQVLGGEGCAWDKHFHYSYTLPASLFVFSDRLWNRAPLPGADTAALTRQILCCDKDAPDAYALLGGAIPPLSDSSDPFLPGAPEDEKALADAVDFYRFRRSKGCYDAFALEPVLFCLEARRAAVREITKQRTDNEKIIADDAL